MIDVQMPIHMRFGAGEATTVDQAGVVLGIGVNGIASPDERGNCAKIRGEAGSKDKRRLRAFEFGQPLF